MSFLAEFFAMAMTAIFLENVIFSRALGASRMIGLIKKGNIFVFGACLTLMTTLSALASHYLNGLITDTQLRIYLRPALFVAAIILLYIGVYWGMRRFLPKLFERVGRHLCFATFNCALLGAVFLTADQNYNLAKTLGFGLGSGIGFAFATFIVYEGRRRLVISDVPHSFRGFPILLLYLGLVALAMYGLVGHQLPF